MSNFWAGVLTGAFAAFVIESIVEYVVLRRAVKRLGVEPNLKSFLRRLGV